MRPPQHIEFSIPSHPVYLQMVRAVVEKTVHILGLAPDLSGRIILAVDEASSNVIKHAYGNQADGRLDFLIEMDRERLEICITDDGKTCDISRMKPRDLDDVKPGGLGVYIISQVMDKVVYTCGEDSRNSIRMIKFLPPPK